MRTAAGLSPLLLLVLALLLLPACAQDPPSPPETGPPSQVAAVDSISVGRTPGKPMRLVKPGEEAERITARKTASGYELVVTRNVAPDHLVGTAALSPEEWQALVRLVEQHDLSAFAPQVAPGEVYDWPSETLAVSRGAQVHRAQWDAPLTNAAGVDALCSELGRLAKAKVGRPELYYILPRE